MEATFFIKDDINALAQANDWPSLSLYIPILRNNLNTQAVMLQLKHFQDEAQDILSGDGKLTPQQIRSLFEPVTTAAEECFRVSEGAKVGSFIFFISEGTQRFFLSPCLLPAMALVDDHFELRPLLSDFEQYNSFNVLAISQNQAKLFRGTKESLTPLELPEKTPTSLAAHLENSNFQPKLAYHATGGPAPGTIAGKWYGTVSRDKENIFLEEYVGAICEGTRKTLGNEPGPIIVASVEKIKSLVKKHLDYTTVLTNGVDISPDKLKKEELLEKTLPVVEHYYKQKTDEQISRYRHAFSTKYTASTLSDIMQAAISGQIEVLLSSTTEKVFGRYDAPTGNLEVHRERQPYDTELVSAAVREALLHGAKIYVTKDHTFPSDCPMGAILRWS